MSDYVHDDTDDQLDNLTITGVNKSDDYNETGGYVVLLHAPDTDTVRAVLDRWRWT